MAVHHGIDVLGEVAAHHRRGVDHQLDSHLVGYAACVALHQRDIHRVVGLVGAQQVAEGEAELHLRDDRVVAIGEGVHHSVAILLDQELVGGLADDETRSGSPANRGRRQAGAFIVHDDQTVVEVRVLLDEVLLVGERAQLLGLVGGIVRQPAASAIQGRVEGHHFGTVVDVGAGAVGGSVELIVVVGATPCGQFDLDVNILECVGAAGHQVEDTFALVKLTRGAPDTEVTLTVTRRVVLVGHLDARIARIGAVQCKRVVGADVTHPTAVIAVVIISAVNGKGSTRAPTRTGVGAGGHVVAGSHHVGVALQHAVARRIFSFIARWSNLLVVVHLNIVTAEHTDLVGRGAQRRRRDGRVAAEFGLRSGQCSRVDVAARGADERLHLVGGGIHEKGAAAGDDDVVGNPIHGIHLGDVERVDAALTLENDVDVVEHEVVGTLDGGEVTRGRLVRAQRLAVVAQHDGVLLVTGVARGTRTIDATVDAHIVGVVLVGGGGVVFQTVHIDVRLAGDGGSAELVGEGTPVAASPHRAFDVEVADFVGLASRLATRGLHGICSVIDGILAHKGVDRTEAVAEETGGVDLLSDMTTADVDCTHGLVFVDDLASLIVHKVARREGKSIVSVTRAAIHVAMDITSHHVYGMGTSYVYRALLAESATVDMLTNVGIALDVDDGVTIGRTELTATEHVGAHCTTTDGDSGSERSINRTSLNASESNIVNKVTVLARINTTVFSIVPTERVASTSNIV